MTTPATLLGYATPGTPEADEYRRGRLGASDIGIVLGVAPPSWPSAFQLWHERSGILERQNDDTDAMTVGRYCEDAIRGWWASQHPGLVLDPAPGTWVSTARPWQLATPDGLVYPEDSSEPVAVLECKFTAWSHEWGTPGTAEIPPHYLAQVTQQIDVMGVDVAHVAVLFGGEARFAEYVVPRDPANVRIIRDAGAAFVDSLGDMNRRPRIDERAATLDTVRRLNPSIADEDAQTPPGVCEAYAAASAALAYADAEHRRAKAVLLDAMGLARRALDDTGRPRFRRQAGARGAVALHPIRKRAPKEPRNVSE